MTWTKKHSRNAVAAKERKRRERGAAGAAELPVESAGRVFLPRRPKPDFKITIESRNGDRVQMSLLRLGKRFLTGNGEKSARQIGRGIETLLRFYD